MNPQFKKGVLELVVLESVRKRDMYGYELVEEVSKVIDVNEGTIYPLLKRMNIILKHTCGNLRKDLPENITI